MSMLLSKLFTKRGGAVKAAQVAKGDTVLRDHVVEHTVVDEFYGHDHSKGHSDDGHKHHKKNADEPLTSSSPTTLPSFALHLWSALPILLLAMGGGLTVTLIAVLAAFINFFIIQMRVHTSKRYVASGIVSLLALLVFLMTAQ